jgi:hypothetical protein
MWILTPIGFFSVVQKPLDRAHDALTLRARIRADLEALQSNWLPELGTIRETRNSDYRFRASAPKAAVAAAMARAVQAIGYDNFKDEVARRQGYGRAQVYSQVWDTLYGLQDASH